MSDLNKLSEGSVLKVGLIYTLLKWVFASLALVLLIVCMLIFALLALPAGRVFIVEQGLSRVPLPENITLKVEEVTSPDFGRWLISEVHLSYEGESLVLVENFDLHLGFDEIFAGHLHIHRLAAQMIELWPEHFPAGEPAPELSQEQQREQLEQTIDLITEQLQVLPIAVHLHDFHVGTLKLQGESLIHVGLQLQAAVGTATPLAQIKIKAQFQQGSAQDQSAQDMPVKSVALELSLDAQQQLSLSANAQSVPQISQKKSSSEEGLEWESQVRASIDLSQQPYRLEISDTNATVTTAAFSETFELAARADLMPGLANIHKLTLEGLDGIIAVDGEVQQSNLGLNLSISHLDLSQFLPDVEALILDGKVKTTGPIEALMAKGDLSGDGQVQGQRIRLGTHFVADGQKIELEDFKATVGDAVVEMAGRYLVADLQVKAKLKARGISTSLIEKFGVTIPAEIAFNLDQADMNVAARLPAGDQALTFNFDGTAKGTGQYNALPLELNLQVKGDENSLRPGGTRVLVNQTAIELSGEVEAQQRRLDLNLNAVNFNKKTLMGSGIELPPASSFSQDIAANIKGSFSDPQLTLTLKGKLAHEQLALFNLCEIKGGLAQIQLNQCLFAEKTPATTQTAVMNHTADIKLDPLVVESNHVFQKLAVNRILKVLPEPMRQQWRIDQLGAVVNGDVQASVAQDADGIQVQRINSNLKLSGQVYQQSLKGNLQFSVRDVLAKPQLALKNIEMNYGNSRLALKGDYGPSTMALELKALIESADLAPLPVPQLSTLAETSSKLNLQLDISGSNKDPQLAGHLKYQLENQEERDESTEITDSAENALPYILALKLAREPGKMLQVQGTLGQGQATSSLEAQTNGLALVLNQIQGGPAFDLNNLKFKSSGELGLAGVHKMLNPVMHDFSGLASWQANYDKNIFAGKIQIQKGSYEHLSMGTRLKDISLESQFDLNGIEIVKGVARDGGKGRYELSGYLQNPATLSAAPSKPTNLQFRLVQTKVLDRPDIELTADGAINITAAQVQKKPGFLVKGAVALQPLTVKLDQAQTSQVSKLNVKYVPTLEKEEAEKSKNKKKDESADKESVMPPIALDIALKTEQQAFLRGKGIDAEIGGNIKIIGTADAPQIDGFYRILRGRAEILGKRFALETGELRLNDGQGIINLKAVHKDQKQSFIARVTGSLQNPRVSLTSEPPMPEDETVSRLLFGKSLSDVTAVQALRIAAAVRSLSTSGGFDPIATTRDVIGVDQVSVESETNESGGSNYKVGVGKYVSERVYVEIERSTSAIDPWQGRVEVDLTDRISIETTAESTSGVSGIDLNWKRDY